MKHSILYEEQLNKLYYELHNKEHLLGIQNRYPNPKIEDGAHTKKFSDEKMHDIQQEAKKIYKRMGDDMQHIVGDLRDKLIDVWTEHNKPMICLNF